MTIRQINVKVSDLLDGYSGDNEEEGIVGYGGQLDIRPKFQRAFIYNQQQQREVIRSVLRGFPLNVMYWIDRWEDPDNPTCDEQSEARYELLDGQQRTLSICSYVDGDFSVDDMLFDNQPSDIKRRIMDYELLIYVCHGEDSEKLDWFRIINIAGEHLNDQELHNAVYAGPWVSDAKRYFSRTSGPARAVAGDYMEGAAIRQDYLKEAISWIAKGQGKTIEEYMAEHQHDPNAAPLWDYFRAVFDWVRSVFPNYRRVMKGLPWGLFYNAHHDRSDLDPQAIEETIQRLMADDDVTRQSGIYEYILTGDDRALSIRKFLRRDINAAYARQQGRCAICGKEFPLDKMHADHIVPWSRGGHTTPENLQMLCVECNLRKGAR